MKKSLESKSVDDKVYNPFTKKFIIPTPGHIINFNTVMEHLEETYFGFDWSNFPETVVMLNPFTGVLEDFPVSEVRKFTISYIAYFTKMEELDESAGRKWGLPPLPVKGGNND